MLSQKTKQKLPQALWGVQRTESGAGSSRKMRGFSRLWNEGCSLAERGDHLLIRKTALVCTAWIREGERSYTGTLRIGALPQGIEV